MTGYVIGIKDKLYSNVQDSIFYIKKIYLGGEPFIKMLPTDRKESAAIYDKPSATFYMNSIMEQNKGLDLFLEEVNYDG